MYHTKKLCSSALCSIQGKWFPWYCCQELGVGMIKSLWCWNCWFSGGFSTNEFALEFCNYIKSQTNINKYYFSWYDSRRSSCFLFANCVKESISHLELLFFFFFLCSIIPETHESASQNRCFCKTFFFPHSFPEAAEVSAFLALFEKWCNAKS